MVHGQRKRHFGTAILAAALWLGGSGAWAAPDPGAALDEKRPPLEANGKAIEQGWAAKCTSAARNADVDCAATQRLALAATGQLLASVALSVPAETRKPQMIIQVPLGLFLPAGIVLTTDDSAPEKAEIQTCDANGCYARLSVTDGMIKRLGEAKTLKLVFKGNTKQDLSVSVPLDGFTEAWSKVK